jgi:hypothetical protein
VTKDARLPDATTAQVSVPLLAGISTV